MDEAERELSADAESIVTLYSIPIVSGTGLYTLAAGTKGIIRVLWKGEALTGAKVRDLQADSVYYRPGSTALSGRPRCYIRHDFGVDSIQLYPVPNENIAAATDDADLVKSATLQNHFVVVAYRVADPTNESRRLLPHYRRAVCKYYALWKAYEREGPEQVLNMAEYYRQRWDYFKARYLEFVQKRRQKPLGLAGTGKRRLHPKGSLPSTGRWSF